MSRVMAYVEFASKFLLVSSYARTIHQFIIQKTLVHETLNNVK